MSLFKHTTDDDGNTSSELSLGQPERWLTEAESIRLWARVYGEGLLAPDEMRQYRVIVAWRLTRALAYRQGRLKRKERLAEIFDTEDSWSVPMAALTSTVSTEATKPPDQWSFSQLMSRDGGLALVPVTKSGAHRVRFSSMVTKLAESMWIERGSTTEPRLGEYGLYGLTHPDTIVKFWPSKQSLVAWEEELLQVLQRLIIDQPRPNVTNYLQDNLDLTMAEARGLFLMATALIKETYSLDADTDRAIIRARQEKAYHNAVENGDPSVERALLKDLSHELEPAERTGTHDYFITSIKHVSAQRSAENIKQIELQEEDTDAD